MSFWDSFGHIANQGFNILTKSLTEFFFFPIGYGNYSLPLIVFVLVAAGLFFTFYLRFVNVRLLKHAFVIVRGKGNETDSKGEVSNLSALLSAISGTVGMGSIAGVAIAVALGGAGVIFWIIVGGILGMASKFTEVSLSLMFRRVDADGKVFGGPFNYIEQGLAEKGWGIAAKVLGVIFAVLCLGAAFGGGAMFQSNQAVKILSDFDLFRDVAHIKIIISVVLAVLIFIVLLGSIKRIAKVADWIGPSKGIVFLVCALIIIAVNIKNLPAALASIFTEAFSPKATGLGLFAVISLALRRVFFANEAGLGSAPIAHAAAKTKEPIEQGAVALIEPLFAACVGVLSGLCIVITGAAVGVNANEGILITKTAFATVSPIFTYVLAFVAVLFAYGTMMGWSYYGEIAVTHLFGRRIWIINFYKVLYAVFIFWGGIRDLTTVMDFGDVATLGMGLPSLVALFVFRKEIRAALDSYMVRVVKVK